MVIRRMFPGLGFLPEKATEPPVATSYLIFIIYRAWYEMSGALALTTLWERVIYEASVPVT
ncbi:hypothetical protein Taro_051370 [Colocasia esculenta]|uniref:Uncharacterized protein n=1 Tax=Colocasia esculenta TaxID=4460 RepID=A0A843XFS6_COLES|nr:hypothetical protein [Colocasia esculenta]